MSIPVPALMAAVFLGLILGAIYLFGLTKKWGILVPYSCMLLFGSMSLPVSWNDRINPTVWLPIQQIRSELFLASGIMGLVVLAFQVPRLRGKPISLSLIFFALSGLYAALLRFVHGGTEDGLMSVVFVLSTLTPLLITSSLVMDCIEDFLHVLHAVMIVNIVWIGMVFVQIVVNSKYITAGNEFRFVGLLANPQHTGVLMAFFTVISIWLLLNGSRKLKIIYIGLLGINTLFLLWTGSRTGLGMALIGVSAVLYTRAGRAILFLPFAAILTYISFKVMVNVVGVDFGFGRMTSTANTRGSAWANLYRIGMEHPAIGVGTVESENSENSWLYGFSSYGAGMLGLMSLFTIAAIIESYKNIKLRFSLPSHYRPYLDLVTGAVAMYFAGAVLEGYMVSRVSASMGIITIFAGAGVVMRKFAKNLDSNDGLNDIRYDNYEYYQGRYDDSEYTDDTQ